MRRVLELAADPNEPLLERVKFCGIFSSILDEFFMVRVAGLQDQVVSGRSVRRSDGRTPQQALGRDPRGRARADGRAVAALAGRRSSRRSPPRGSWSAPSTTRRRTSAAELERVFARQIFPVLTPLAVGPGPAVPVHLGPLAEPRASRPRPGGRRGALRAGQGAGGARPLRLDRLARSPDPARAA